MVSSSSVPRKKKSAALSSGIEKDKKTTKLFLIATLPTPHADVTIVRLSTTNVVQQQLPFLRIGHGQPVRGTKILADCFEAVLGEFGNALAGDFCRYQRVPCTDLLLPVFRVAVLFLVLPRTCIPWCLDLLRF